MATPGQYLIINTVTDCNALLMQLEQARRLVTRVTERMEALGTSALADYNWPEGYTQQDFVNLYQALDALPGSVVADAVRDALYDLVSYIQ